MQQVDAVDCENVAGGMALVRFFMIGIGDRVWNAADRSVVSPGNAFESTPFLDALAAGNMGA